MPKVTVGEENGAPIELYYEDHGPGRELAHTGAGSYRVRVHARGRDIAPISTSRNPSRTT
ncbi:hypothetical protein AB0878_05990 [Amycolatopsis sp. NPDC047767]|uniref:hypothetical protein n=1 Tax=Amycolatopsis sp. NPDC047767 TaxID=3156765 RepID=UPI003453D18F